MTAERNGDGLVKQIDYKYTKEGFVDWRAMINDDHVYINERFFEEQGLSVPESKDGLGDENLIIGLAAIKELARLRGFNSIRYITNFASPDYVSVTCEIEFIGNFETDMKPVVFSDIGAAHRDNTSGFASRYLDSIATNRAFSRAVRNFLNIHIVSSEEISSVDSSDVSVIASETANASSIDAKSVLQNYIKKKFKKVKSYAELMDVLKEKNAEVHEKVKDVGSTSLLSGKDALAVLAALKS